MPKNISRRSKYSILKEYGYTPKQADKMRSLGREKFTQALMESPKIKQLEKENNNIEVERRLRQISGISRSTGIASIEVNNWKDLGEYQNQRTRYLYIIEVQYSDGDYRYFSIPTDYPQTVASLQSEVREYAKNYSEYYEETRKKKISKIIIQGYRKSS